MSRFSSDHQEDKKIENNSDLQSLLSKQLGPEYLSTRPGAGGTKLTYVEGWRIIALANEVFGYDGWNSETKTIEVDFVDQTPDGRFNVGVSAVVKITLQNGTSREDVGYGKAENSKSKADALDKCKKEAVTDALKRTMRMFGNLMGNCLYDKSYLNNIKTMQAQKEKFLPSKLYRPEHVSNQSTKTATTTTTESKLFDNQSSSEEKELPKQKLPNTVSNNSTTPKSVGFQISKTTVSKTNQQVTKSERKFDPTGLPQPKIPEKRKFQEEKEEVQEKDNNSAEETVEEEENTTNHPMPPPATLSDTYFDFNETELAELDNVESSEMFGIQSAQGCSGDESGLITDASAQIEDQSENFALPHPIYHHQNPPTKREKTSHQPFSRPSSQLKSNTTNSSSNVKFNIHDPPPAQKLPLKTGHNLLNNSARNHSNKVIQAGQLPSIKSSVIRYPTNNINGPSLKILQ